MVLAVVIFFIVKKKQSQNKYDPESAQNNEESKQLKESSPEAWAMWGCQNKPWWQYTGGAGRDADSEPGEWGEELSDEPEHQWSARSDSSCEC